MAKLFTPGADSFLQTGKPEIPEKIVLANKAICPLYDAHLTVLESVLNDIEVSAILNQSAKYRSNI